MNKGARVSHKRAPISVFSFSFSWFFAPCSICLHYCLSDFTSTSFPFLMYFFLCLPSNMLSLSDTHTHIHIYPSFTHRIFFSSTHTPLKFHQIFSYLSYPALSSWVPFHPMPTYPGLSFMVTSPHSPHSTHHPIPPCLISSFHLNSCQVRNSPFARFSIISW